MYNAVNSLVYSSKTGLSFRSKPKTKTTSPLKAFYKAARLVHIYISMVLLALLFFFCLTGIFLNHPDWFDDGYTDGTISMALPKALQNDVATAKSLESLPVNELQQYIRENYHLKALHQLNFDQEMGEAILDYQLPAGYATAYISADEATLEFRKGSWVTIMNDLHKGRHSGPVWSWVIDLSALFMLFFSIAGFVILIPNKKHRKAGLWAGLLGVAVPLLIIWLWVPSIRGL